MVIFNILIFDLLHCISVESEFNIYMECSPDFKILCTRFFHLKGFPRLSHIFILVLEVFNCLPT